MNTKRILIAAFILLCLLTFGYFLAFNAINDILIRNGYYPIPSYYIVMSCYLIVYLLFALKFDSSIVAIIKGIGIVLVFTYLSQLLLSNIYEYFTYMPDNEIITPVIFLIFIVGLLLFAIILRRLIINHAGFTSVLTIEKPMLTSIVIILTICTYGSYQYDYKHVVKYYMSHVENIINDAVQSNSRKCDNIAKMYFRYDELTQKYPYYSEEYYGIYHPYLYEDTATNICRTASTAVIQNDHRYCINDELKADLTQKSITNINNAKVFELRTDNMLKDAIVCINVYRKHRPKQSDNALEYARQLLVDSGWSVSENDFQSECQDQHINSSIVCEYLTVDNHDDR